MARAVLIAGDGKYFLEKVYIMQSFLREEVGMEDVHVLQTPYLTPKDLDKSLAHLIQHTPNEPLFLFFSGHGNEQGWGMNTNDAFSYKILVQDILAKRAAPTLIVNDCCCSFSLARMLEKEGCSPELLSVIAAGGEDENVNIYSGFVESIAQSWRISQSFMGRATLREVIKIAHVCDWREKLEDFAKLCAVDLLYFIHPKLFRAVFGGPVTLHYDRRIWRMYKLEVVREKRWGAVFDHYFFAKDPKFASDDTVCLPQIGDLLCVNE